MNRNEIADVIDRAAEYMVAHGWCQQQHENDAGNVCCMGAVLHALEPNALSIGDIDFTINVELSREVERAMRAFIQEQWEMKTTVPAFNDTLCHSKNQAVQFLRQAARWVCVNYDITATKPFTPSLPTVSTELPEAVPA